MAGPTQLIDDLKFEGGRFEQRGLPVSVLSELQVYCELVVKVARAVFLRDNPERRRVPNRFGDRFRPYLLYLADGSIAPVLERELIADPDGIDDEFVSAARHIGDIVASIHHDATVASVTKLPRFDIGEISRLGTTLEPSERILLRGSDGRQAVLDAHVRQYLEDYRRQTHEARTRLVGRVTRVDATRRMLSLWVSGSSTYCRGPFSDSDLSLLKRAITSDRVAGPLVELEGLVLFDKHGEPSGWTEPISITELPLDIGSAYRQLETQLRTLAALNADWFDGESMRPTSSAIGMAREIARLLEKDGLPAPTAFPTPEGGVSLEWVTLGVQIGVTIWASGSEGELSYWNERSGADDLKRDSDLSAGKIAHYVRSAIDDSVV